MASRETILIRAEKRFVEEILNKILEQNEKIGAGSNGYPEATKTLRIRIEKKGGLN